MQREERIAHFEAMLDRALQAAERMEAALAAYDAVQPEIEALAAYYESPDWKRDFAADEAGQLPDSLKRGVLSEDGIWDLLERYQALKKRIGPTA